MKESAIWLYSICQRYNFESNLQRHNDRRKLRLYSICQRYNFESNLQRSSIDLFNRLSCIRYVKDTILKAIYNTVDILLLINWLYSICQRYNFESNLQPTRKCGIDKTRCIRYVKDTILKAIYNNTVPDQSLSMLYSICQRYNFESNLQRYLV